MRPAFTLLLLLTICSYAFAQNERYLGTNYKIRTAQASPDFASAFEPGPNSFLSPAYSTEEALDPRSILTSFQSTSQSQPIEDEINLATADSLSQRLASLRKEAPPMFGDSFSSGPQIRTFEAFSGTGLGDSVLAGGSQRTKIAENSRALTEDRVFFMYNHFRNAVGARASGIDLEEDTSSISQFTLGFEKSLLDNLLSIDVRMPFTNGYDFQSDIFGVTSGRAGNLAVSLKALLNANRKRSFVAGMTVNLPTGADSFANTSGSTFLLENNSVTVAPFVGLLCSPKRRFYQQLFLQLDVPVTSNNFVFFPSDEDDDLEREIDQRTLLYVDYQIGRWLYRVTEARPASPYSIAGIAAQCEFHLTTTLDDSESAFIPVGSLQSIRIGNLNGLQNILNVTVGIHTELSNATAIRIGGVFPMGDENHRLFDSEVQAQVNIPF